MALSGDNEAQLSVEGIVGDEDIEISVTLDEINQNIQPITDQLGKLLHKVVSSLKEHEIEIDQIDVVELLGDVTRTKAFT